jgi:hypothetical protein
VVVHRIHRTRIISSDYFGIRKAPCGRGARKISGSEGGTITVNAIRTGRGQVGPCLTDEAHRPLPERHSHVSRYAAARILQQRSLRRIFAGGVMVSPLLRTGAIAGPQLKLCGAAQSVKVLSPPGRPLRSCRRGAVLLVRTPRNDDQIGIRQRPLQRFGFIPWRSQPQLRGRLGAWRGGPARLRLFVIAVRRRAAAVLRLRRFQFPDRGGAPAFG